jgi:hypothetical protein
MGIFISKFLISFILNNSKKIFIYQLKILLKIKKYFIINFLFNKFKSNNKY